MKATTAIAGALLLALPIAVLSSTSAGADPCAAALEGWQVIPDTAATVPSFVFESRLDVDRLIVCEDGAYFFFKTREWGRVIRFCLAYPKPTQEQYAKYFGTGEVDVQKRTRELLEAVARGDAAYREFLGRLEEVMGGKYRLDRVVSFENKRFKPELSMKMGEPIRFEYRKKTVEFSPMMDVYFVPPKNVPAWVTFVLLYPR
ncbi:MAG: hypothetical protein PVF33_08065 [Candidatus Latescibacterota bacterium]|jgi:hypothetical protein